jgi:hypothetical protein
MSTSRPRIFLKGNPKRDEEFGELKVSLGIISARAVLSSSTMQRLRRWLRKRPFEEQVAIPSAQICIRVQAEDEGTLDVYLNVVNFAKVPLQVEQLQFDWVGINGAALSFLGPQPLSIPRPIEPKAIGVVAYRILLVAASIRQLIEYTRPSTNAYSTPGVDVFVRGALTVTQRTNRALLRFELHVLSPAIALKMPAVNEGN